MSPCRSGTPDMRRSSEPRTSSQTTNASALVWIVLTSKSAALPQGRVRLDVLSTRSSFLTNSLTIKPPPPPNAIAKMMSDMVSICPHGAKSLVVTRRILYAKWLSTPRTKERGRPSGRPRSRCRPFRLNRQLVPLDSSTDQDDPLAGPRLGNSVGDARFGTAKREGPCRQSFLVEKVGASAASQ